MTAGSAEYKVPFHTSPVNGTVTVPGSKSITNRLLLLSSITEGNVWIRGIQKGEDAVHFIRSMEDLGIMSEENGNDILIHGNGGRFPAEASVNVGSGGTGARFLSSLLALSPGEYRVDCSEQMSRRPMDQLFKALRDLGAGVDCCGEEGHLPAVIRGVRPEGRVSATVDTDVSTQFLSALLLSSPLVPEGMEIHVTGSRKKGSYVGITLDCLKRFGVGVLYDDVSSIYYVNPPHNRIINPETVFCEPDVSAACYFYAAAALTGGSVCVSGLCRDSVQGDMRFITDVLVPMGCSLSENGNGLTVTGPVNGKLGAVDVDMQDFSDQALTLAAIAPWADGPVHIRNVGHIRKQECDRMDCIRDCMERAGVRCDIVGDDICIFPGEPGPCRIDTRNDHRAAMAMSLMGLRTRGVVIENPDCCRKTFPGYFRALDDLLLG